MVTVTHSIPTIDDEQASLDALAAGLQPIDRARLEQAVQLAVPLYHGKQLGTGEDIWRHAQGVALIAASLKLDVETRLAALLFALPDYLELSAEKLAETFGAQVAPQLAQLVDGLRRLKGLRLVAGANDRATADLKAQTEVLRKMLLAMSEDVRVVLLRLASRTQTLRFYADHPGAERDATARESLDLYAPLANRLGIWQLKWELEDLSFRYIEPQTYKKIASMLDERRLERSRFIADAIARLQTEIAAAGIEAEVFGRPKHIYSIYNKMRGKNLEFSEVYDVRALRVLVHDERDCYMVLGMVHRLWQPISGEFDDYIAHPKGNYYRSLHTSVMAEDGRALEVQIRTHEMHRHAELGVAAHWRYKEGAANGVSSYADKIAWLRQLLSWRDEVTDSADWAGQFKRAALDDTVYVLTPQGRVIDLPRGATPIDFAYRVHTDLGHRCRGAKIDGHLVPLNTPLENGQRIEIISVKQGGPSRDWLNPQLGFLATSRARSKAKQWFGNLQEAETLAQGRAFISRELQHEGMTQTNIDELAHKFGLENGETLYLAAGRGDIGVRQLQVILRGEAGVGSEAPAAEETQLLLRRSKSSGGSDVLIVGVDKLLTQLGRCCKPAPPDHIGGYVTHGRGVSIHRGDCRNFAQMVLRNPERVIGAEWDSKAIDLGSAFYAVDIFVEANDRQGLLRDISEVLSREKINVTAVSTQSRQGDARMSFTIEVSGVPQLQRVLALIREVQGVVGASRR